MESISELNSVPQGNQAHILNQFLSFTISECLGLPDYIFSQIGHSFGLTVF